ETTEAADAAAQSAASASAPIGPERPEASRAPAAARSASAIRNAGAPTALRDEATGGAGVSSDRTSAAISTPGPGTRAAARVQPAETGAPAPRPGDAPPAADGRFLGRPALRAAYADASGVHLLWILGSEDHPGGRTELLYPHDSDVGRLLQSCYDHLSELGYPVADLRPWSPAAEAVSLAQSASGARMQVLSPSISARPAPPQPHREFAARDASPAIVAGFGGAPVEQAAESSAPSSPAGSGAVPHRPPSLQAAPGSAVGVARECAPEDNADRTAASAAAKTAPAGFVMRLHPPTSDHPGRAVVSPVEDDKNLQVVIAPERLVRALHAAAVRERGPDERVTYLKCSVARGGLKIVAVGLGEKPDGEASPARWKDIEAWWAAAQKAPAAKAPSVVSGAEPELF
ncbi:MAG: hypothetical protein ACREFX_15615, partial [Opitutaceae bacterium]